MIQDVALALDAFVRSIRVSRHSPHALFLGAGASISSGVPGASHCIWEWKRDIFLRTIRGWKTSSPSYPSRESKSGFSVARRERISETRCC